MKPDQADPEGIIQKFEQSLLAGDAPQIKTFLTEPESEIPLLTELVAAEIEHKLKSGIESRVEEYLLAFPGLKSNPDAVKTLVVHEYIIRQSMEPSPTRLDDFSNRFPQHADYLNSSEMKVAYQREMPATSRLMKTRSSGRYALKRLHARGGLGSVWVAKDDSLHRDVAVKEVKAELNLA